MIQMETLERSDASLVLSVYHNNCRYCQKHFLSKETVKVFFTAHFQINPCLSQKDVGFSFYVLERNCISSLILRIFAFSHWHTVLKRNGKASKYSDRGSTYFFIYCL